MRKYFGHKSAARCERSPNYLRTHVPNIYEYIWKYFGRISRLAKQNFLEHVGYFIEFDMFSILDFQRPQIGRQIIFRPLLTTKIDRTATGKSLCLAKVLCVHKTVEKLNTETKVVL